MWGIQKDGKATAIVVTALGKIGETPTGLVWIASGHELENGLSMLEKHIEPWFREKGCKLIEINGRKGWGRMLPEYRELSRVFVKEL